MAVPDFQTLMLPVLESAASGEATAKGCVPEVVGRFSLSDDDVQEMLPSGRQQRLMNRLHWAKIFLERACLLKSVRRGVFTITDEGRKVLSERPDRIDMKFLERFESYREWRSRSARTVATTEAKADGNGHAPAKPEDTPDDRIDSAFAELEDALREDLLTRVRESSPAFFERLIVDLLVAMGYGRGMPDAGRAIGKSGDGGIDGVIDEDALGLDAVYIQAKRYGAENKVGRPAIQQFVGSLHGVGATKGVFVTTSDFSDNARAYARQVPQRITLIDGQQLALLLVANEVGVRARRTYVLRTIDEDCFVEE